MSWIQEITDAEAKGALRQIYDSIAAARGKVANVMRVHSLNPGAMQQHLALYQQLMFGSSGLSRLEREKIAVAVSTANRCAYCIRHHEHARKYLQRRVDANSSAGRILSQSSNGRTAAMLAYAQKLTIAPHTVRADDIHGLRAAGFSDRDILDINLIVSYFNFVNRIALGLGVEFSEEEIGGYRY